MGKIGFYFHTFASPSPNPPSSTRQSPITIVASGEAAILERSFYVPENYALRTEEDKRYPVVVNLHGGGFTMGTSKDDGRWAAAVLEAVGAIFVSVEYRLAPQFPFPTAVEDGVKALPHLAANSETFGIDSKKMALSGFSAGENMAFTTPLRL
ncbi:hypothetical protein N7G274_003235 [Stereocaulon virgatum]|uniref:Alpha/beta hydrolase fold-3 domain-containing protein n=1 Tax=Stereocaulon virgatum TaxID=373712 RepID=A0ABR4AFW8_9LECA